MMEPEISISSRVAEQINLVLEKGKLDLILRKELKEYQSKDFIPFRLVKQIHDVLSDSESGKKRPYLHELIEGCDLHLPKPAVIPRNPELEARCQKLRAEQENRMYRQMVRNVDKTKEDFFSPGKDLKEMNRQLVSVFNFIITVGGAFAFGYKATEYSFNGPNIFGLQLIVGLTMATVVFFADLYFLIRESEHT